LLLPAYVFEVHREYPTAYGDTVRFLDENAGANDTVYAYPEHANYPLMFYTGDKLRFGCLLNKDTHLDGAVVASLDAPLLIEENFPDWIVSFGTHSELAERIAYFSRPHERDGNTTKYRYTLSEVLDVYFADTHRPEIMWHSFGPRRRFDRQSEAVYIFRRSADSPEGALRRAPDRPPAFSSRD
jgi:hypothetical protein